MTKLGIKKHRQCEIISGREYADCYGVGGRIAQCNHKNQTGYDYVNYKLKVLLKEWWQIEIDLEVDMQKDQESTKFVEFLNTEILHEIVKAYS